MKEEKDGPRIHLASLGCAKNLVDSERLLGLLATEGGIVGASPEEADFIIVNTCGFIAPAKRESIETIREYIRIKRRTGAKLFVIGCLVTREGDRLRRYVPGVDRLFGLNEEEGIAAACGLGREDPDRPGRLLLTPPHTAYLRISEGCDHNCTYCTIPLIRGPFRSRPAEDVIEEAEELVASGVREINLIGQDTTSYGVDLDPRIGLDELLRRIAKIPDLHWIRLLYTHPSGFTDPLIEAYADIDKFCEYVDLPLQHANDRILRRMGRGTTKADSLSLIERLREAVPGIALRTTFIAGFPGETESDFQELLEFVREVRFDHLGVFPYSREEGTPAARMRGQIPGWRKHRRVKRLMLTQQRIVFEANRRTIGKKAEAVIDSPTDEEGIWIGRMRTQAPDTDSVTFIEGEGLRPGLFVDVEIIGHQGYDLIARPIVEG